MSLVSLSCPNCGGNVQYDFMSLIGKCPYCGYLLENSEPSMKARELLRKYQGYKTVGDKAGQRLTARCLQREEPGDFRGWWGEYTVDVVHDEKISYLESFPGYTENLNKMARICVTVPDEWKTKSLQEELAELKQDCKKISLLKKEAIDKLLPLERRTNSMIEALNSNRDKLSKFGNDGKIDLELVKTFAIAFVVITSILCGFLYGFGTMNRSVIWGILGAIFMSPFYAIVLGIPEACVGALVGCAVSLFMRHKQIVKRREIQKIIAELESDVSFMQQTLSLDKSKIQFGAKDITVESLISYLQKKEDELNCAITSTEKILNEK